MKSISIWAKHHVWPTRIIIILIIYPLLNLAGWLLGDLLYLNNIHLNLAWMYVLALVCFFLCATYPSRKNKQNNFYVRQKLRDVLLALCTFCFIVLTGNNSNTGVSENASAASVHAAMAATSSLRPTPWHLKKGKKKTIRQMLQRLEKKYRDAGKGTKVLLVILTLLAAVLLVYLLAALSCSVACSGAEALAYILFLVGLAGIIFGATRIIHRILKGPREKNIRKSS
jgi:hypothetical protein